MESLVCRRAPAAKLRKKDTVERKNDQGEISKIDEWVEVFNIPIDFAVSPSISHPQILKKMVRFPINQQKHLISER